MYSIEYAVAFATKQHRGQMDKSNEPYIFHPLRVMLAVRQALLIQGYTVDQPEFCQILAAAVLHDVVEDTPTTIGDIARKFDQETAVIVDYLSRRDGEGYKEFIERVSMDRDALLIKREDIMDNMDPRRVTRASGLYTRYAKALYRIKNGVWP